jgi:hypothetical protein
LGVSTKVHGEAGDENGIYHLCLQQREAHQAELWNSQSQRWSESLTRENPEFPIIFLPWNLGKEAMNSAEVREGLLLKKLTVLGCCLFESSFDGFHFPNWEDTGTLK